MRIIPHKNGKEAYSLRVSKKVPKGAANLAYVYSESVSPSRNLSMEDEWKKIIENIANESGSKEHIVFPDGQSRLTSQEGVSSFDTEELLLTDEYDVEGKSALYWKGVSNGLFDARNSLVVPYKKGREISPKARRFEELPADEREELLYLGDKISIIQMDGNAVSEEQKFKVKLIKEGITPFTYRIEVYTSFVSTKEESYLLKYRRYGTDKQYEVTESLNVDVVFERVSKSEIDELTSESQKMEKKYAVVKTDKGGFEVYAKAPMLIVSETTRPAHHFKYQLGANLTAKLSTENQGELKIGYIFVNDTESGANIYELGSVGKKLLSPSNTAMPSFLKRENPHTRFENEGQDSVDYWLADLDMPASHYMDYDVLVLAGYGDFDMSRYNMRMQAFVEKGGTLIVDNNGVGNSALNFEVEGKETFFLNMGFGEEKEPLAKVYPTSPVKSRYFNLSSPNEIGRVNAEWRIGEGQEASMWNSLVGYTNGEIAVGWSRIGKGRVVWSSVGLMAGCLFSNVESTRFMSNLLLWTGEERYVLSPERKDFVHHKNSLFRKEYISTDGEVLYYDGRSDDDMTQLVAKKVLAPSVAEAMRSYLPKGFEKAKGSYEVLSDSDTTYSLENSDFENAQSDGVVEWQASGATIPGWEAQVFAGTATFRHEVGEKRQGQRSLSVESTSGHAFFQQALGIVPAGTYEFGVWMMPVSAAGVGARIGIYKPSGELVQQSESFTGTSSWSKRTVRVSLNEDTSLVLRVGFIDGNGSGKVYFDQLEANHVGAVRMTRSGDGSERLYAYATLSRGKGLDLQNLGFDTEDVVIHHPTIEGYVKATAFVYQWNNNSLMYQPVRGQSVLHPISIRKDMGRLVLGKVEGLLPPTGQGAMWADKNRIYYEFEVGSGYDETMDKKYVDIELYDPMRRSSFYSKDGKAVISHYDLFGEVGSAETVLEVWTSYYTLQATKKQFALKVGEEQKVEVLAPGTDDARENWYPRVKNGMFRKNGWNISDLEEMNMRGRNDIETRTVGDMVYTIPSYEEQAFYPEFGVMARTEVAKFMNTKMLQVDRAPLIVKERSVTLEELEAIDSERKVFQAEMGKWNRKQGVSVYLDEFMDGTNVKIESGFMIDFERGRIVFEESVVGIVRASYSQDNFKVSKRRYMNEWKKEVRLKTSDRKTWSSIEDHWLSSPAPVLYKGVVRPENIISPEDYEIDYASGQVYFKEVQPLQVFADFRYFVEEELEVEDIDMRAGIIRLKKEISFKDEIYVDYLYAENHVDYKGYYDVEAGRFIHLDLNPSSGHLVTVRRGDGVDSFYEDVESENLLNKEVFLYLLPSKIEFSGGISIEEEHPLRHALSEKEWGHIKKGRPEAMLLSRIQVRENTNVENTIVMDARRRGGGLKESVTSKEIERRGGSVEAFWDIGGYDGVAYYEKGVVVVKIPKSVLAVNGGRFTEEEVLTKVKQHMAYGVYPIVEYV